jgi:hypothetical protein
MRILSLSLFICCLLAGGCVVAANDTMGTGETVRLEAFAPQPKPSPATPAEQVIAPSLTGISRANWEPTQILIPVDGTAHHPIYARRTTWADKTARQRGMNPTATSALELYSGSEQQQEYEALNNQARALSDVVLMLPRMLAWRPWGLRASPDEAYQRYWHPERPEPAATSGPQSITP